MKLFLTALLSIALCLCIQTSVFAGGKKITITTTAGASITVDGKLVGTTQTKIIVPGQGTVKVKVEKVGYITQERNYTNTKQFDLPNTDFIDLEKDDAWDSSSTTDMANRDIDVKTSLTEDEAWKLLSRVVTDRFDVIEVTDKTTGYMRTAWVVKKFKAATVRTRLIIKAGSDKTLSYKVKLVSEIGAPDASSRQDEDFREWDRLLRGFENVVPELQSRLGK